MLKIEKAVVHGLDASGFHIRYVDDEGATSKSLQGKAIVISYESEKTKMYVLDGFYKRDLYNIKYHI